MADNEDDFDLIIGDSDSDWGVVTTSPEVKLDVPITSKSYVNLPDTDEETLATLEYTSNEFKKLGVAIGSLAAVPMDTVNGAINSIGRAIDVAFRSKSVDKDGNIVDSPLFKAADMADKMGWHQFGTETSGMYDFISRKAGIQDIAPPSVGAKWLSTTMQYAALAAVPFGSVTRIPMGVVPKTASTLGSAGTTAAAGIAAEEMAQAADASNATTVGARVMAELGTQLLAGTPINMAAQTIGARWNALKDPANKQQVLELAARNQIMKDVQNGAEWIKQAEEVSALKKKLTGFNPSASFMFNSPELKSTEMGLYKDPHKAAEAIKIYKNNMKVLADFEATAFAKRDPHFVSKLIKTLDTEMSNNISIIAKTNNKTAADTLRAKNTGLLAARRAAAELEATHRYAIVDDLAMQYNIRVPVQTVEADLKYIRNLYEQYGKTAPIKESPDAAAVMDEMLAVSAGQGPYPGFHQMAQWRSTLRSESNLAATRGLDAVSVAYKRAADKLGASMDDVINQSGASDLKEAYSDAISFYKNDYVDVFKSGAAAALTRRVYNKGKDMGMAVPDEKIFSDIFLKSEAWASQFRRIYGDDPVANRKLVDLALDHINRNYVDAHTGTLKAREFANFLSKEQKNLQKIPGMYEMLTNVSLTNTTLSGYRRMLAQKKEADAVEAIAGYAGVESLDNVFKSATRTPRFTSMMNLAKRVPGGTEQVATAFVSYLKQQKEPLTYLRENWESYVPIFKALGKKHEENIKTLLGAKEVMERFPKPAVTPQKFVTVGAAQTKFGTSITGLTSTLRAVAEGRLSEATAASYLASRYGAATSGREVEELMFRALHDPKVLDKVLAVETKLNVPSLRDAARKEFNAILLSTGIRTIPIATLHAQQPQQKKTEPNW